MLCPVLGAAYPRHLRLGSSWYPNQPACSSTQLYFQLYSALVPTVPSGYNAENPLAPSAQIVGLLADQGVPKIFATLLCDEGGLLWMGGYDPSAITSTPLYTPLDNTKARNLIRECHAGLLGGLRSDALVADSLCSPVVWRKQPFNGCWDASYWSPRTSNPHTMAAHRGTTCSRLRPSAWAVRTWDWTPTPSHGESHFLPVHSKATAPQVRCPHCTHAAVSRCCDWFALGPCCGGVSHCWLRGCHPASTPRCIF